MQPWPFRVLLTLGLAFFFPSGVRLSEQRKKSGMFGFMANQPNPPSQPPEKEGLDFRPYEGKPMVNMSLIMGRGTLDGVG